MSERLNGTHEIAGKPALRDDIPMHGTANEGMGRPQSSTRSDGRAGAEAQEACKRLELLLRETVHRCTNDLQLVVSLLSLQAARLKDREGRAALEDAAERIAILARARAATSEVEQSALATALRQVCEALQAHAELRSILISLEIGDGCDEVASPLVTPICLAVNELATNAIKHAFEAKGGKITVVVRRRDDDVVVQVDDDGLPILDAAPSDGHGLGLGLVRRLVSSCGGKFHQPPSGSKTFEIVVPSGQSAS
jgi:two-component sensor histidine kinase